MKKFKWIKSSIGVFVVGVVITAYGLFTNIFAEADLITPGGGAAKTMGIAIAIGAGLIFISAMMFIFTGTFKHKED